MVTHLGDNDGVHDRHWLPGLGVLNWEEIMRWLPVKTYQGSLTLEVFSKDQENEPVTNFMAASYRSIEWLHGLFHGEG